MATGAHRNNFDALRLMGAGMVLYSHMFALSGRPEPYVLGMTLGTLGVLIFFAISGYLVAESWRHDPSVWRFAWRRALRIVPALVVVVSLTWAVLRLLGIEAFNMNPIATVNPSLWTIPIEVKCYAILCVLAVLLKRASLPMVLVFLLYRKAQYDPLHVFGMCFAVGAAMSDFPKLKSWLCASLMVAVGVYFTFEIGSLFLGMSLIVAPITVMVGLQSWPLLRSAGAGGDFSYGIYLYAGPVQQLTVMLFPLAPIVGLFAFVLPATTALAYLSWHCTEKPALRMKRFSSSGIRIPQPARAPIS